jgi:hypothetical protein
LEPATKTAQFVPSAKTEFIKRLVKAKTEVKNFINVKIGRNKFLIFNFKKKKYSKK